MKIFSLTIGSLLSAAIFSVGAFAADDTAPAEPIKISAPLATADADDVSAKTVPLPSGTKDANLVLDLGYDIATPTLTFNDALVAFSNIDGLVMVIAPELSDPAVGTKELNFTPGRISLRDFITQVCGQVGAVWTIDENQSVVLSKLSTETAVISESGEAGKVRIDADFAGVPLALVASNLAQRTGARIRVEESVRDLPIEIIVQGWELDRILKYLADMYPLDLVFEGDNNYALSHREISDDEADEDTEFDPDE